MPRGCAIAWRRGFGDQADGCIALAVGARAMNMDKAAAAGIATKMSVIVALPTPMSVKEPERVIRPPIAIDERAVIPVIIGVVIARRPSHGISGTRAGRWHRIDKTAERNGRSQRGGQKRERMSISMSQMALANCLSRYPWNASRKWRVGGGLT